MDFIYNSQKEKFKNPFGAVEIGTEINISIKIKKDIEADCQLYTVCEGKNKKFNMEIEGTEGEFNIYSTKFTALDKPCAVFYYFIINLKDKTVFLGNQNDKLGGNGKIYESNPVPYQITVPQKNISVPN